MSDKIDLFFNKIKEITGFGGGHERSNKAKKNILASLVIKGLNILIGILIVPITINYLDPTRYGIFITLTSLIAWFGFFDIGLGHGLRNKFAQAIAANDHLLAKTYVSTTYALLSIIAASLIVIVLVVNNFVDWNAILNTSVSVISNDELKLLVAIVFSVFFISFVLKLITVILLADQRPSLASFFEFSGRILALTTIVVLTKTSNSSLLYFGIAQTVIPVLVLLISNIWFFKDRYNQYKPSFKFIDFSKTKDILNLGLKFFVIQIASVLLYQTNNIIITQLFGPESVTTYSIANSYFSVLTMFFSIVVTPFWSAFTEAWTKNEISWIKNIMKKLVKVWLFLLIMAVIMLFLSPYVYELWIGNAVIIPFSISLLVTILALINSWNSIFSQFLNGVGKIKLQMNIALIAAFFNVPLSIYLGKVIGFQGILIANVLVLTPGLVIYPIQYYKIISGKATGLFNK